MTRSDSRFEPCAYFSLTWCTLLYGEGARNVGILREIADSDFSRSGDARTHTPARQGLSIRRGVSIGRCPIVGPSWPEEVERGLDALGFPIGVLGAARGLSPLEFLVETKDRIGRFSRGTRGPSVNKVN